MSSHPVGRTRRHLSARSGGGPDCMQRIAEGDVHALAELYDRHARVVYTICLRILHSQAQAEELVQEVFWEAWTRADRYDPARSSPSTYLVRIARSRALDRLRRSRRREQILASASGTLDPEREDAVVTPLQSAEASQDRERVRIALRALSDDQRAALILAYFDGLSHSEIAEHLGLPLGTIKTRIRRGLMRLRDALSESADGDGST